MVTVNVNFKSEDCLEGELIRCYVLSTDDYLAMKNAVIERAKEQFGEFDVADFACAEIYTYSPKVWVDGISKGSVGFNYNDNRDILWVVVETHNGALFNNEEALSACVQNWVNSEER